MRRKPYSVILFDEIEKAHKDVFNVLLQVLDDGRITDSKGKTVDFKNTILIMTSNIGSSYLLEGIDEDGEIKKEAQNMVMEELKLHFRPEFLNRLDETILFKPLTSLVPLGKEKPGSSRGAGRALGWLAARWGCTTRPLGWGVVAWSPDSGPGSGGVGVLSA